MEFERIASIIEFLQSAEKLKDTIRSGITSSGRTESTAEHTWRLCLMVMMFEDDLGDVNFPHLLKLCIIHDLGEAISGDIPAIHQNPMDDKSAQERLDLITLCSSLPSNLQDEIIALWDEYDAALTAEAQLAKGFDKLETMLQHLIGKNASNFDYQFNLTYGLKNTDNIPLLRQIRELVDISTARKIEQQQEAESLDKT